MATINNTKQELLDEYKRLLAQAKAEKTAIPDNAKGITSKNNKSDMLNAITALENAMKKPEAVSSPAPLEAETPAKAEKANIQKKNTTVFTQKEDNDLSYLNQEIVEKIQALDTAKSLKKAEYNDILAVEQELVKFVEKINMIKTTALAQAEIQKAKSEEQKETIEKMKSDTEENIKYSIENAEKQLSELKDSFEADRIKLENQRAVEEEAYNYKTSEEKKKSDDAWNDEVAQREENIRAVEERISAVNAEIASKAELKTELEAKLAELPELIKKAEEEGAVAKEKELGKEYGYKSSKAKKEAENNIQALQEEIEMLRKDFEDALAEKQAIQAKLDKAYEANNILYMQTVQSTGGVKILNNSDKA